MNTIDELLYYCREIEPVGALLLTGEWGCGKTYLIEHELKSALSNEAVVIRVTLFGVSSIEEIHKAIKDAWMSEYYKIKGIDKITDVVEFVKGKAKDIPLLPEVVKNIASTDITSFFPMKNELDGKKVILVFDDLERCCIRTVDVLGIINDYCENQKYHTIIVANQEKISEQQDDDSILAEVKFPTNPDNPQPSKDNISSVVIHNQFKKTQSTFSYQEIKEKIIQRTTQYIPDYSKIVHAVILDMKYEDSEYKDFLLKYESNLLELFAPDRDTDSSSKNDDCPHNIRSLKCALQDFYRIYKELKENEISNIHFWLYNFTSFLIAYKANYIQKDKYGYLFADDKVRKLYPAYNSKYMLNSIKKWVLEGIWDKTAICEEIKLIKKREMPLAPWEIIRINEIMDIDEDVLQKGFGEFLNHAYDGTLTLDDYVLFIKNTAWAEKNQYTFPLEINWNKIKYGIKKKIEEMKKTPDDYPLVSHIISESNQKYFSNEAWSAYSIILEFRKNDILMFLENQKLYVEQISQNLSSGFTAIQSKRFNTFSNEMAKITAEAFFKENNAGKRIFILAFTTIWEKNLQSPDIIKDDCILGLKELISLLEKNLQSSTKTTRTFSIIHTENFIKKINNLIDAQTVPESAQ